MALEEKLYSSENYIYELIDNPEERKVISPPERYDELVAEAKRLLLYDGHVDYLREMRYPLMGEHYVRHMRRGRRYEGRLREVVGLVYKGNLRGLDILMFYKVFNDARHILDGTVKGSGLESKLNLSGWRGRRYSLDELREKWKGLMSDRRLNPRVKEFFQLLDRYDSKITDALDYALFLKGAFPKPLEPGTIEKSELYREGVRRALRYLEEVILFSEELRRDLSSEGVNRFYQNLFVFNGCGDDYCPVEVLRGVVDFLFRGVKDRLRQNLPFLEAYIISRYNPVRENGYYVIENRVDFVDGSALIDTVKVPIYSRRQNMGRRRALEILKEAGYDSLI